MTTRRKLKRIEYLIWILVYGGLLAVVLGLVTRGSSTLLGRGLLILGVILAMTGTVLVFVRARLQEDPP